MKHTLVKNPSVKKIGNNLIEIVNMDNFLFNSSYIVFKDNKAIIFDPSFVADEIIKVLKDNKLEVTGIILTHGHWDHWLTAKTLVNYCQKRLLCNRLDQEIAAQAKTGFKKYFSDVQTTDFDLKIIQYENWTSEKTISIGGFNFKILPVPGHTAGCVCFRYQDYVFSGDHIFSDSVGHTLSSNSRPDLMADNILKFLKTYGDECFILPGHGEGFYLKDSRKLLEKISVELALKQ